MNQNIKNAYFNVIGEMDEGYPKLNLESVLYVIDQNYFTW